MAGRRLRTECREEKISRCGAARWTRGSTASKSCRRRRSPRGAERKGPGSQRGGIVVDAAHDVVEHVHAHHAVAHIRRARHRADISRELLTHRDKNMWLPPGGQKTAVGSE